MPSEQVTILIPDISGYTDYVSKTEIDHSAHILNHLLETIVNSIDKEYVVAEIEGDAVLLYKKGNPPNKKEILEQCVKTFTAFHTQILGIDNIRICQCVACSGVINLSLKFVIHFGTISENRVSGFVKASGIDMIIAHRLLKNRITNPEYLLITKSFLQAVPDADDSFDLSWSGSQEEYSSIGTVAFDVASMESFRRALQEFPKNETAVISPDSLYLEIEIEANYKNIFATLIDLELRQHYIPEVQKVDFIIPVAARGMKFYYFFKNYQMEIEPVSIETMENEIRYAEYHRVPDLDVNTVIHYTVTEIGDDRSKFVVRICPEKGYILHDEAISLIQQMQQKALINLKLYCEKSFDDATNSK